MENPWKPGWINPELSQEDKDTEKVYRNVRGILNKLTPQKVDTLMQKFLEIPINSEKRLLGVIDLIFEKKLLFDLTFFLYHRFQSLVLMQKSPNCELFKLGMLTQNIMYRCMEQLLQDPQEESLECLCKLLTTIGRDLEFGSQNYPQNKPVNPQALNPYFARMNDLAQRKDETKVSSRVRFMLLDVIDLRLNKWIPKREDITPKTIEQINREVMRERNRVNNRQGDSRRKGNSKMNLLPNRSPNMQNAELRIPDTLATRQDLADFVASVVFREVQDCLCDEVQVVITCDSDVHHTDDPVAVPREKEIGTNLSKPQEELVSRSSKPVSLCLNMYMIPETNSVAIDIQPPKVQLPALIKDAPSAPVVQSPPKINESKQKGIENNERQPQVNSVSPPAQVPPPVPDNKESNVMNEKDGGTVSQKETIVSVLSFSKVQSPAPSSVVPPKVSSQEDVKAAQILKASVHPATVVSAVKKVVKNNSSVASISLPTESPAAQSSKPPQQKNGEILLPAEPPQVSVDEELKFRRFLVGLEKQTRGANEARNCSFYDWRTQLWLLHGCDNPGDHPGPAQQGSAMETKKNAVEESQFNVKPVNPTPDAPPKDVAQALDSSEAFGRLCDTELRQLKLTENKQKLKKIVMEVICNIADADALGKVYTSEK